MLAYAYPIPQRVGEPNDCRLSVLLPATDMSYARYGMELQSFRKSTRARRSFPNSYLFPALGYARSHVQCYLP
jgi:hypothetical protein